MARKPPRLSKRKHETTAEIEEAAHFFRFGYLIGCGKSFLAGMGARDRLQYWRKHKTAIMAADDRQRQAANKPYQRCYPFWEEIERENPRRQTGVARWIGPCRPDGGDRTEVDPIFETDAQYLHRLNLLAPWELEAAADHHLGPDRNRIFTQRRRSAAGDAGA